jgi:hypothetical protein
MEAFMSKDKEHSIFFEVVVCYHPTEFDKVGCDGMYIEEVKKIDTPLGKLLFGDGSKEPPIGVIKFDDAVDERAVFAPRRYYGNIKRKD